MTIQKYLKKIFPPYLQTAIPPGRAAAVDLRYEDTLVVRVVRVPALPVQATLYVHAQLLAFLLHDC